MSKNKAKHNTAYEKTARLAMGKACEPNIETPEYQQVLNNECEWNHQGEREEEFYLGYCFFEDGRYCAPVHLEGLTQAARYFELQRMFQHRVIIVDSDDCIIAEAVEGEIVYPSLS